MRPNKDDRAVAGAVLHKLGAEASELCELRGWRRDWVEVAGYLHGEVAEFVEAIRGKRSDPEEEAADVLFVLLSGMNAHGLSTHRTLQILGEKMDKIRAGAHGAGQSPGFVPEEPRTTKARIAVAIDDVGNWAADGASSWEDTDEDKLHTVKEALHEQWMTDMSDMETFWVEVDLPLPEPKQVPVLDGKVADGE